MYLLLEQFSVIEDKRHDNHIFVIVAEIEKYWRQMVLVLFYLPF